MSECFKCGRPLPKQVMEPNITYCIGHYEEMNISKLRLDYAALEAERDALRDALERLDKWQGQRACEASVYHICDDDFSDLQHIIHAALLPKEQAMKEKIFNLDGVSYLVEASEILEKTTSKIEKLEAALDHYRTAHEFAQKRIFELTIAHCKIRRAFAAALIYGDFVNFCNDNPPGTEQLKYWRELAKPFGGV